MHPPLFNIPPFSESLFIVFVLFCAAIFFFFFFNECRDVPSSSVGRLLGAWFKNHFFFGGINIFVGFCFPPTPRFGVGNTLNAGDQDLWVNGFPITSFLSLFFLFFFVFFGSAFLACSVCNFGFGRHT
ncbi:hypothetical protein D8B26_003523 [Coccidioides posadasii str. Silveira]|uniref:uncharacterized protein n=1 Tax=Coccidioides posadasii (strain RMSCC 757 / Silveira) TaxID=443226 RepID=UPI001BEF783F|nr:hypothetical protein D8B26_003523 [Coccidioides posadasii str. Silveira]